MLRLTHYGLAVTQLDDQLQSLASLTDATLTLRRSSQSRPGLGWELAFLRLDGQQIELMAPVDGADWDESAPARFAHLGFSSDAIDKDVERAQGAGFEIVEIQRTPEQAITQVFLRSKQGLLIEVYPEHP